MSLKLDCGTEPEAIVGTTPACDAIVVAFQTHVAMKLSNVDMASLVRYWLTNTDLKHEDARMDLIDWISRLKVGPGYNPGEKRRIEN